MGEGIALRMTEHVIVYVALMTGQLGVFWRHG